MLKLTILCDNRLKQLKAICVFVSKLHICLYFLIVFSYFPIKHLLRLCTNIQKLQQQRFSDLFSKLLEFTALRDELMVTDKLPYDDDKDDGNFLWTNSNPKTCVCSRICSEKEENSLTIVDSNISST